MVAIILAQVKPEWIWEFTYEMAWKTIKRYLEYEGIEAGFPRPASKRRIARG